MATLSPGDKTMLVVARDIAKKQLQAQIDIGLKIEAQPQSIGLPTSSASRRYRETYEPWHAYNVELLSNMFTTNRYGCDYDGRTFRTLQSEINALRSFHDLLEFIPEDPRIAKAVTVSESQPTQNSKRVFVVHGHDNEAKQTVARFLEKLGLQPIILHNQSNRGQTIIEKFEEYSDVRFAVVLITPDDIGASTEDFGSKGDAALRPRARQNVVFEHGFLVAKLGCGNVCALVKGNVEILSDVQSILYARIDRSDWGMELVKEMRAAGLDIDLNKVF
jgi:predicted nucleotide-binding protein